MSTDRRRFFVAAAIGCALAVVVFLVVLLDGHLTPFRVAPPADSFGGDLGRFYDLQAHSLLHLHWNVPARPLGIEGFHMDDGSYMYFGPWPAVLRLPIAAVTDGFDGRLTQPSMLLAFVVALVFTARLAWRIRTLVLVDAPVRRVEQWVIGAFVFVVGTGSVLVFLGGQLLVFHEAAIWGVALAIGAFEAVIAFTVTARLRYLGFASLLTMLTLFSRPPLGAAPLAALGLLFLVAIVGRGSRLVGFPDGVALRRLVIPLAAAVLVPVVLYVALNEVKFGTPFSLPFGRQVVTVFSPGHRAVLKANGGTLVGSQFIPTNLLQYFRPDAIRFSGSFPWVAFPGPAKVLGSVRFDWVTPASSVPASMPLLTVLGIVGLAAMLRPRRASALRALRAPVLGCVAAGIVTVAFGFVAQRYLADFVPLFVLLALAGLFLLMRWSATRPRASLMRFAWAAVALLAVLSVWFSTGLAFAWQNGLATPVLRAREFPALRSMGTLLVLGNCDGLYRSTGVQWRAMELTPKTGRFLFRATFPDRSSPGGTPAPREPLIVSGRRGAGQYVFVEYRPDRHVVFGYLSQGHGGVQQSAPVPVEPGREYLLDIVIEPHVAQVSVQLDGAPVLDFVPGSLDIVRPVRNVTIGRNEIGGPVARRFTGRLVPRPVPLTLCPRYRRVAVEAHS